MTRVLHLAGYSNGEGAWGGGGGGGASSYQSAPAVIGLDDVSGDGACRNGVRDTCIELLSLDFNNGGFDLSLQLLIAHHLQVVSSLMSTMDTLPLTSTNDFNVCERGFQESKSNWN